MTDDLDKFFEELEQMADKAEVERLRNKPLPQTDLDRKILDDFHGFAPTIDESLKVIFLLLVRKLKFLYQKTLRKDSILD